MDRKTRSLLAATALCAAALAFSPRTAHAYDVNGLGVGADVALGGPTGLAVTLGLGRLELDFIVGMSLNLPEGGVLEPDFAGAAGVFYTLTDAEQTNLQIGGRVGVIVASESELGGGPFGTEAELETNAAFTVEVDVRVEHRLDDHCVINLQVGIGTQIWPDDPDDGAGTSQPDFVMGFGGTGLVGGAGFRYYFDSLGGTPPPVASAPAAAPARRAEPAAEPAAAPAAAPAEGGAEQPYWE